MNTVEIKLVNGKSLVVKFDPVKKTGEIKSTIKLACHYCKETDCYHFCEMSVAAIDNDNGAESEYEVRCRRKFNNACSGIESFVLSCACLGVDVGTPQFREALQRTYYGMPYSI